MNTCSKDKPADLQPSAAISHYRRPLPAEQIAFDSAAGRVLFREALAAGYLEVFFPLIEQFHTQADPAFCGLGSLVMLLNALKIDPGRLWRGPWRWFSEELLDCCRPLEYVRAAGISIEELACLARCNGASAKVERPKPGGLELLRQAVLESCSSSQGPLLIASYLRSHLGQSGSGHFSPIGGYHPGQDRVLLLDVARFKYPPHWVSLEALYAAMPALDPVTNRARGWISLTSNRGPTSLAYFVQCTDGLGVGEKLATLLRDSRARLRAAAPQTAAQAAQIAGQFAAESNIVSWIALREPCTPEHQTLLQTLRAELGAQALYVAFADVLANPMREFVSVWLLAAPEALWADLAPGVMQELQLLLHWAPAHIALNAELGHLRQQIQFLLDYAQVD